MSDKPCPLCGGSRRIPNPAYANWRRNNSLYKPLLDPPPPQELECPLCRDDEQEVQS